jgi:hypothetical protein
MRAYGLRATGLRDGLTGYGLRGLPSGLTGYGLRADATGCGLRANGKIELR